MGLLSGLLPRKIIEPNLLVKNYLIPYVDEIIDSELDLLFKDVQSFSSLDMPKKNLKLELFIFSSYLSGRGLSLLKGFDMNVGLIVTQMMGDEMKNRFDDIILNPEYIDAERGVGMSVFSNYYKNKATHYRNVEMLYHTNKISKDAMSVEVSKILLNIKDSPIDARLCEVIGDIHKGAFMLLFTNYQKLSKEYQVKL